MNGTVAGLFTGFLDVLIFAIVARVVLVVFPGIQRNDFSHVLVSASDPLVGGWRAEYYSTGDRRSIRCILVLVLAIAVLVPLIMIYLVIIITTRMSA